MHQIPLSSSIKDKQDKTLWRSFVCIIKESFDESAESSERLNLFPKPSFTKITHKFMDIVLVSRIKFFGGFSGVSFRCQFSQLLCRGLGIRLWVAFAARLESRLLPCNVPAERRESSEWKIDGNSIHMKRFLLDNIRILQRQLKLSSVVRHTEKIAHTFHTS